MADYSLAALDEYKNDDCTVPHLSTHHVTWGIATILWKLRVPENTQRYTDKMQRIRLKFYIPYKLEPLCAMLLQYANLSTAIY